MRTRKASCRYEANLDIELGKLKRWNRLSAVDPEEVLDADGILTISLDDVKL